MIKLQNNILSVIKQCIKVPRFKIKYKQIRLELIIICIHEILSTNFTIFHQYFIYNLIIPMNGISMFTLYNMMNVSCFFAIV